MTKFKLFFNFFIITVLIAANSFSTEVLNYGPGDYKALLDDDKIETGFFATKPYDKWNFELANRSNREIRVIVKIGMFTILDKILTGKFLPTQTPKIRAVLPQTTNIDLIIQTQEDDGTKKIERRFTRGKNIFLSYEDGDVHPQEGFVNPLQKMKKTTKSGLPLDNNVTQGDIIIVD
ncbi:MAG: hypothetical protein ACOYT8_03400 [Candidatus Dependentiae bacterium]